jgi:subtilase family serine protease
MYMIQKIINYISSPEKMDDKSFEIVAKFKYSGTTVTVQSLVREKIKSSLNSRKACYHSVQKLLSSRLLSKNVKTKYTYTILSAALNERGTWSVI